MNDACDILSHLKINMYQIVKEEIVHVIKNFYEHGYCSSILMPKVCYLLFF